MLPNVKEGTVAICIYNIGWAYFMFDSNQKIRACL